MKKIFTLVFFITFFSFTFAQKIKVKNDRTDIAGKKNDVLVVNVYEANEDVVEKAWRSLMKGYGGKVSSGREIVAKNVIIKEISEKPIDVYAKIDKTSDGINFIVGFDLGGAFICQSLHPDQYKQAEKILSDFSADVTKQAFEDLHKDQTKKLEIIQRKQDKLVKENDGLHSDIEKYKKRIQDAENDIKTNLTNQDNTKKDIEAQKKVVEDIENRKKKAGF